MPNRVFATGLPASQTFSAQAQKNGVKFQFGADVTEICVKSTPYVVLRGSPNPISFEGIAVCTGEFTASLKNQLKIKLPLAAVHGYSVSAMLREPLNAPNISVMDVDTHVVITRMGNRLRISGGAELGGVHNVNNTPTIQSLYRTLHRYFPGCHVSVWRIIQDDYKLLPVFRKV